MTDQTLEFGYVAGMELTNIRAFKRFRIDLNGEDGARMLSLIIGRNGAGKSTLLRCIALGLCHQSDAAALLAESDSQLVSEGADQGSIRIRMTSVSGEKMGDIHLVLHSKAGRDIIDHRAISFPSKDFFMCGYGSIRGKMGKSQARGYRSMDSVATLFDYNHSLVDSELMLRRLEDYLGDSLYNRTLKGIKRVLGLGPEHTIHCARGGGVKISGPGIGAEIPLDGWADGYRMTFNWVIDLYGWAMKANAVTESGGVRGILIVDEIDQHLHPSMQASLLHELQEMLPEMQIFATTHNPMTALSTESENIISLHRENDHIEIGAPPSLMGYSMDDVLSERDMFDVDPYPRGTRRALARHRALASIPSEKRTRKQQDEMASLAAKLDPSNLPTLRDDPISKKLDKITEFLKKEADS